MVDARILSLAVGDGGVATSRFLQEEILSRFDNDSLREFEDASLVNIGGTDIVVSTDSYVVDPYIFPGGDIGRLAISGTVNDVLASGGKPLAMTMGLVLAEGFPLSDLRILLDSAASTAKEVGVNIIAGDTKVVESTTSVAICINTTGIGSLPQASRRYRLTDTEEGDLVIITGTIGDHALAVLSEREGLGLERRVKSDCAPLHDLILPLLRQFEQIHSLRDPTRAGLAGVLHDLVDQTGLDVCINARDIPVLPEVNFCCEMLGLAPLNLANEGKMVLTVSPDQADEVLSTLRQHPLGRKAAVIGKLIRSNGEGQLLLQTDGLTKVLNRIEGQPLPRLC